MGAGLGSVLFLALLSFWFIRRRRAKKPGLRPLDLDTITTPKSPSFSFGNTLRRSRVYQQTSTPAMTEVTSPTFSGHKSELPADSPCSPITHTPANDDRPDTATSSTIGSQGLDIGAAAVSAYHQNQHQHPNQNHNPGPYFPNHPQTAGGRGTGSTVSEATNNTHARSHSCNDTTTSISRAGSAARANGAEASHAQVHAQGHSNPTVNTTMYGHPPPPQQPRVYMPYHPGLVGTSDAGRAQLEGIHEMPG